AIREDGRAPRARGYSRVDPRAAPLPRNAVRTAIRRAAVTPQASSGFIAGEEQPGLHHGVRIQGHALDALIDEPAREIGVIRGALAADADVLALLAAGRDGHAKQRLHGVVALVEQLRDDG